VVNLATRIPPLSRAALPSAWKENDRIRRHVSHHLARAAQAAGAETFVQESIAFAYPDSDDRWIDASTSTPARPSLAATVADAEAAAAWFTEQGGRGVVLRFGQFLDATSFHTRAQVGLARRRLAPVPGPSGGYVPTVAAADAGRAVAAALAAPAGTYDVVDDEPATRAALGAAMAEGAGQKRAPRRWPPLGPLGRINGALEMLLRSQRVSNRRFRDATGWAPTSPSASATARSVARMVDAERAPMSPEATRARTVARIALAFLVFTGAMVGLWALADPRGFYDSFPGGGRTWVSVDGPYNEHLVRDVGAAYAGFGLLALIGAVRLTRGIVMAAGWAWVVFATPHLVYHLAHTDLYSASDAVAQSISLGGGVAFAVAAIWASRRLPA
jgi:nucleoside-diphosphate-sugar epimerase